MRALSTARLRIEPMEAEHAPELYEKFRDPALYTWILRTPPEDLAKFREGLAAVEGRASPDGSEAWLNWVGFDRVSGEIIGTAEVSLIHATSAFHLAYTVFRPFQRRGYAYELCAAVVAEMTESFGARKLIVEMDVRNLASVRLAEKLGAVLRAFNPKVQMLKGEWSDEFRYEKDL